MKNEIALSEDELAPLWVKRMSLGLLYVDYKSRTAQHIPLGRFIFLLVGHMWEQT